MHDVEAQTLYQAVQTKELKLGGGHQSASVHEIVKWRDTRKMRLIMIS